MGGVSGSFVLGGLLQFHTCHRRDAISGAPILRSLGPLWLKGQRKGRMGVEVPHPLGREGDRAPSPTDLRQTEPMSGD